MIILSAILIVTTTLLSNCHCSHYKGGTVSINWRTTSVVNIAYESYYRRNSPSPNVLCTQALIESQTQLTDSVNIYFYLCRNTSTSCSRISYISHTFTCKNYDEKENWSIVERSQDVDLSGYGVTMNSDDSIAFTLSNSAWVSPFGSTDYNWMSYNRLLVTSSSNQGFNSAPSIKTFPHRNLICGCESSFQLLPYDADNDIIRCRLSKYSGYKTFRECGYCLQSTSTLVRLDEKTCTIYFSSDMRSDVILEIQIEDFENETSIVPKSSTTLQFSTKLDKTKCPPNNQPQNPSICTSFPVFTQEVPPYGACYAVELNPLYKGIIEATSSSQNISAINVNAFQGFLLQSPLTYNPAKKSWYYNYTITSNDTTTVRQESIVLEAIDSSGLASPQHTYNYLLNFVPPKLLSIANLGSICYRDQSGSTMFELILNFNRAVIKPDDSSARILFVNAANNDVVYSITTSKLNNTLPTQSLTLNIPKTYFKVFNDYAILFEFGAFVVDQYCRPQTDRVTDTDQFRFHFIDDTAQIVFSVKRNEVLNGNSSIKWTISDGYVENCFIRAQEETIFQRFDCSNQTEFSLKNFDSSYYSFYFTYVSPCLGQIKFSETLNFRLINQKPIVSYTLTNYNGVYATKSSAMIIICSHPITCQVRCRLYEVNSDLENIQFSSCQSTPFSSIQDGLNYVYDIHAIDSVNNTADLTQIRFKADTQPPTLVNPPIAVHQGECGDDLTQIPAPNIQDNFDPTPQISYTDRKNTACSIQRSWLANDHVNNSAYIYQTILLTQQSTITAPSSFNLSCIDNSQVLKDIAFYNGFITIGNNLCNATLRSSFTYSPSLPSRDCDFTLQLNWKLTDDCSTTYADIKQTVYVEPREIPYSPLHLQKNVELSPYFKWAVLKDSSSYRVSLRRDIDDSSQEVAALRTNQFKLSYKLEQNTTYYWNVEYFNANQYLIKLSPSFEFSTKLMSDLSIVDVRVPLDIFPAEDILVSWTVKNIGRATTSGSQWYDSVYGSEVNDLSQARLLGRVTQRRFLEPNGQYDSQFKFKLDERVKFSTYYIFLFIDRENYLDDFNLENNQLESGKLIQVKPIPLPNLDAAKILVEEFGKAGQQFIIEWQVNNIGEGSVKYTDRWTDLVEIFIVDNTLFRSILKTSMIVEKREIAPNKGYLMRAQVVLPQKHFGNANLELTVNRYDTLYETSLENNKISTFITILPPDTPDLSLISFELSDSSLLTGQILKINYTVENEGSLDLESFSWNDEVKILNEANNQVVASKVFRNLRSLARKATYSNQIEINLDNRISTGLYAVSLRIDSNNAIYCPYPSGIKHLLKGIHIQRSLPTWSLKSHSIQVAQTINANKTRQINKLTLNYEVTITLPTELVESLFWTDSYFLSDRSKFDSQTAIRLEESSQRVNPSNGLEYSVKVNKTFELFDPPESETERASLYGTLYFYTFIDESEINEKLLQFDFPISNRITLTKFIPTLNLTKFIVDNDYDISGSNYLIPLTFSVKNIGPLALLIKPRFSIYLTSGQNSIATRIKQVQLEEHLLVGQESEASTILEIPNTYFGKLVLTIRSDDSFAFEFITTILQTVSIANNNTVIIEQPSSVDFATSELSFSTKLESYTNKSGACNQNLLIVDVAYSVENIGLTMNEIGTWNDKIEIVCGQSTSGSKLAERVLPIARQLRYKQNYSQSAQFMFDSAQGFSNCRVDFRANFDGRMFEFDTQNNKKSSCCFDIPKRAEAILEAEILSPAQNGAPISLNSTGFLSVRYVFNNKGNGTTTFVTLWTDNFYLYNQSSATIGEITKNGVLIGSKKQSNLVVDCNSKSDLNILNMQIPFRVFGRWFGFLLDLNSLKLQSTNRVTSQLEFDVIKTDPCDLEVANATLLTQTNLVSAGETISFSFDVFNIGSGDARGIWFDTVYLARFPAISPLDIKLLSEQRPAELIPASFYTSTFELRLPITLRSGTYFIVFVTDALKVTNDVDFNNNQNFIQIEVEEKPPVDVYVQSVLISVLENKAINFNWSFSGSDEVNALRCDQYYLQPSDFFMRSVEIASGFCERFEIKRLETGVFGSINVKKQVEIPMIVEGTYLGMVKTITNLPETNFDNNIGVSNETISILVDELTLNEDLDVIIEINSKKLYKFIPNYSMNAFRVTLTTSSTSAFNDIFIGDDKQVPNENTFRARSKLPFSFNQTATIKNVKPNVYYILIKSFLGTSTLGMSSSNYSITLRVQEIKEIDVNLIYPSQLSTLAPCTFRFSGLFLAKKFEVCLSNLDQSREKKRLCASDVYSFSEESLYATFEPYKGLFNAHDSLELVINGIRIESKTISVIEGELGKIQAKLSVERTVYTPNQTVIAKLTVTNLGDTDAYIPMGLLTTVDLTTALSAADIDSIKTFYRIVKINDHPYPSYPLDNLIAFNENGLGSVVQPRSTSYVRIEIRPESANVLGAYKLYFHIFDEENFLFKYLSEKIDVYKPRQISSRSWSVLSKVFMERVASPEVQRKLLYETVNHLSAHNIKVYRLDELISYHIYRFDGAFEDNLLEANDISIVQDRLSLIRIYPSRYSLRSSESANGAFCFGWQDNLHINAYIDSLFGVLSLTVSGVEHTLYESNEQEGFYESSEYAAETSELASSGLLLITSKLYEISYYYHLREACLRRIEMSTSDGGVVVLHVTCNRNRRISEIVSDDGAISVRFSYSQSNCLTAVNKYLKDDGGRVELVVYTYDSQKRLISATGPGFTQTMAYDSSSNLKEFTEVDRLTYSFEYNPENGIQLRNMRRFDATTNTYVIDYDFKSNDNGFYEIRDNIRNVLTKKFYDLTGRTIYTNQNDLRAIKLTSGVEAPQSAILKDGEVLQVKKYDNAFRRLRISNVQEEQIVYKQSEQVDDGVSIIKVEEYTDPNGNVLKKRKTVDSSTDRVTEEFEHPNGRTESRVTDATHMTLVNRNGNELRFTYDALRRRRTFSYARGSDNVDGGESTTTARRECTYEYRGNSHLVLMAAGGDDERFDSVFVDYTDEVKVSSTRMKDSAYIKYVYDDRNGLISEVQTSFDQHVKYEYNSKNQLIRVVDLANQKELFSIKYGLDNSIELLSTQQGTMHRACIDPDLNRVVRLTTNATTRNSILDYEYEYNDKLFNTQIKKKTDKEMFVQKYYFDSVGRTLAIQDNETDTDVELIYDSNGNRRQLIRTTTNGKSSKLQQDKVDYVINNMNQIVETSDATFTYDDSGNVIKRRGKKASPGQQQQDATFEYYDDGKLKRAVNVNNDNCTYTYDCMDRLSVMNCSQSGVFTYYYHYNHIFGGYVLAAIKYPNGTIVNFIYVPYTSIVVISSGSHHVYLPLVDDTSSLLTPTQDRPPTVIEGLELPIVIEPATGLPAPVINRDPAIVLDQNNKPFSFELDIYSPVDLFDTSSFTSNLYQTHWTNNVNQQIDLFSESMSNLLSISQLNTGMDHVYSSIQMPDLTYLSSSVGKVESSFDKFYKKYVDPICNTLGYGSGRLRLRSQRMHMNKSELIRAKRIVSTICKGAAAFVHELINSHSLTQAGLAFGSETIPYFGHVHNAMTVICDKVSGAISVGAGYTSGAILDKYGISDLASGFSNLGGPASWSFQCAVGVTEYIAGGLISGLLETLANWALSMDPNDIIGPDVYGPEDYIWNKETFVFKIRFENMENASAPAQLVKVSSKVHENFDLRSVRLISFGFNKFSRVFDEPSRNSYFSDSIDYDSELPSYLPDRYEIRVFGTVDLTKREIMWQFKTIDITTGDLPEDASVGLLPPKSGEFGEGYVEFQIDLARTATHMTELTADAVIIFDNNEPIYTNELHYTIDSEAPKLTLEWLDEESFLLVRASDSGSGIGLVSIYDHRNGELISSSDQPEFVVTLDPRSEPYLIYASARDNVGNFNPVTFYLTVNVSIETPTSCPNNCSGNGVCNAYFVCECVGNYTEDDCSRNLTLAELLSEPVGFKFGYKASEIRDHFEFELELDNSFESAFVEVSNFPSELELIESRESRLNATFFTSDDAKLEFKVKVPLNYLNTFQLELFISAERVFDEEENENETIVVKNSHKLPITIYSFMPEIELKLLNENDACFEESDLNSSTTTKLSFEIEQLNSFDKVSIDQTVIYNTFISIGRFERINDHLFEIELVSSEANFEPVNILFQFEIQYTSMNDALMLSKEFVFRICQPNTELSTSFTTFDSNRTTSHESTTPKAPNSGLSLGAFAEIVIGAVLASILVRYH